jgi:hypothetical protein
MKRSSFSFIAQIAVAFFIFLPGMKKLKADEIKSFPFAAINKIAAPPTIDGKDNDECWKKSIEMTAFTVPVKLNYALEQTSLRLLWDKSNIYGLVVCQQKNADKLIGSKMMDDHNLWQDNSVELFFVTSPQTTKQIIINAEGTASDGARFKSEHNWSWNSNIQTRAKKEKKRWIVEFSIPLKSLDISSDLLQFNIVRNNIASKEHSSWSTMPVLNWWQTKLFGYVKFAENCPGIKLQGLPELKPDSEFALQLTGASSNLNCDIVLNCQNKKITRKAAVSANSQIKEKFKYRTRKRKSKSENILTLSINSDQPLYRFKYAPAGEYLAVYVNNAPENMIYLSSSEPAKIYWNSVHTFPGGDSKNGWRLKKEYDIIFDCPSGVRPVNGKKIGISPRGETRELWACDQKYAYSSPNWLATELISTLPENSTGKIYYYAQWGNEKQPEEEIAFKVVKVNPVEPPKRFMTQVYNFWPRSVEEAEKYQKLGINTVHHRGYNAKLVRDLLKAGFYVASGGYFFPGSPKGYLEWPQLDRNARAQDINGNYVIGKKGFQLSPSYRGKYFQEAIAKEREFAKASGISYYSFDMEGYIMPNAKLACFNPETLKRFKEYFAHKFPDKQYVDPRKFEKKPEQYPDYHKIWIHFKDYIWADMFLEFKRRLADSVGQSCPKPGVVISEWSFLVPDNEKIIEETMRGPQFMEAFDLFELSAYSGADRFAREALDRQNRIKKNFPESKTAFIASPSPERLDLNRKNKKDYYYSPAPILPEELKYKIMETAASGMKGVDCWSLPRFNLRAWKYWCEGIAIVNKIEDIVLDGRRIDNLSCNQPLGMLDEAALYNRKVILKNQPKILVKGMELDKRAIIAVSEYRDLKPVTVKVKYPVEVPMEITDVETGEPIADISPESPEFKVRLDKRRCRMFLAKPLKEPEK